MSIFQPVLLSVCHAASSSSSRLISIRSSDESVQGHCFHTMPFGNLRRKSSSKDVRRRSYFQTGPLPGHHPTPPPTAPEHATKAPDLLRPSSAAAAWRPHSRHGNPEKPRPSLPARPSSRLSSSRRSLKARYASDPQLQQAYREHAGNPPPSPPSEGAPGMSHGTYSHHLYYSPLRTTLRILINKPSASSHNRHQLSLTR